MARAKPTNSVSPDPARNAAGQPEQDPPKELLVKPGMKFVAKVDCYLAGCRKEGDEVPFAPGQKAPMNLVRLVGGGETETIASASEGLEAGSGDSAEGEGDGTAATLDNQEAAEATGLNDDGSFQA